MKIGIFAIIIASFLIFVVSCDDDDTKKGDLTGIVYNPENYQVNLPSHFPALEVPADNPLTKQGVLLGRHLFYDPILSADSTMSCASCHLPEFSFTDAKALSVGIDEIGRAHV